VRLAVTTKLRVPSARRLIRITGRLFVALALAFAVLVDGTSQSAGAGSPLRVENGSFQSAALQGTINYQVVLPSGYDSSNLNYPVIYLLHGLPDDGTGWQTPRAAAIARSAQQHGRPAIVVAAQGARAGDRDPEWHDFGPGRNWETATAVELPRVIDQHYNTRAGRGGRALIGISAGGYGAAIIGLHHLERFSVIESWSGYFHPTTEDGTEPLELGSAQANQQASAHSFVGALARDMTRRKTFLGFYIGKQDVYGNFVAENWQFHRELARAKVPHLFGIYAGGHNSLFWSSHQDRWVAAAMDNLLPPV
jgi:putative tributyrin esterase